MRDVRGQDLERDRIAYPCGLVDSLIDACRGPGRDHGDAIGGQRGFGLRLGQQRPAGAQGIADDRAYLVLVSRRVHAVCGRRAHQQLLVPVVFAGLQEAAHCPLRGVEGRYAGMLAQAACLLHGIRPEPCCQQRLAAGRRADERGRDLGGRHDGRGCMDHQHSVNLGRLAQDGVGLQVALDGRVADDVDWIRARPGGGQHGVQPGQGLV